MTELNRAYYADFQSLPSNLIFRAVPLIVATILWNINKTLYHARIINPMPWAYDISKAEQVTNI